MKGFNNISLEASIALKEITNGFPFTIVEELSYQGVAAGSPLLVYDANILYFALRLTSGPVNTNNTDLIAVLITLYNQANAISLHLASGGVYQDATPSTKYTASLIDVKNVHFSRLTAGVAYTHFNFVGYRLTL